MIPNSQPAQYIALTFSPAGWKEFKNSGETASQPAGAAFAILPGIPALAYRNPGEVPCSVLKTQSAAVIAHDSEVFYRAAILEDKLEFRRTMERIVRPLTRREKISLFFCSVDEFLKTGRWPGPGK